MSDLKLGATPAAPLTQSQTRGPAGASPEGGPSLADTFQRTPKQEKIQDPRAAFSAPGSGGGASTSTADQLKQDRDKLKQLEGWIADCQADVKRMQDESDDPQNIRQTQMEINNYEAEKAALEKQIAGLQGQ